MAVFKGNTATTATSTANNIPITINSFSIANKSGGGVTASVAIIYGSTIAYILYTKAISSADSYIYTGGEIFVPANHSIYVSVSGSCDYYFTYE